MTEQVKTDLEIFQQLDRVYSGEKEILIEEKMVSDQMEIDEMDLVDDHDAKEIEPKTTKNQNKNVKSLDISINPSNIKNKKSAQGNIGDDFISFDFSEDEDNENNSEEDEKKVHISNFMYIRFYFYFQDSNIKRKGTESINGDRQSNRKNSRTMTEESLSAETKKKLGKLFHPRAPWFPSHLKTDSHELAEHYGYLSAPRSKWKHFSERLHQELSDLADYLSPTPAEAAARALVVRKCDTVVRRLFPGKKIESFGSFETGLYLPTSDIDLVVVPATGPLKNDEENDDDHVKPPLRKLARALIKAGIADSRSVQVISRARVPIIKFTDRLTGHPVDISFNIASGLDGARFLKEQLKLFPALRPLLLFLKLFLDLRGLNEVFRGGLGSFSAACLLISFFQLHPLMQLDYIRAEDNLGILLLEFLELYGRMLHYDKVGISVGIDLKSAELRATSKSNNKDNTIVDQLSRIDVPYGYYDKVDRGFYNESRPGLLSIQDPQSPLNDLARPSFSISSVRQAFEHAFNLLTAAAHEIDYKSADMRKNSRTDGSLLASLIVIPEKFLRHREYIKRTIISKDFKD